MNEFSFEAELQKTFVMETEEMLEEMEGIFLLIEKNPSNLDKFDKIMRLVHTIKGSALTVGFHELGHFIHKFEAFLIYIRDKKITVNSHIATLLLCVNDGLKDFIFTLSENAEEIINTENLEKKIQTALLNAGIVTAANMPKRQPDVVFTNDNEEKIKVTSKIETISKAPENKIGDVTGAEIKRTGVGSQENSEVKGTILVCDDEEDITDILKDILEIEGYKVFRSHSAREALKLLKQIQVDVLMSDLKMPEMDGLEYVGKVREINNYIPIIFISGQVDKNHFKRFLELGVHDFVEKPFAKENILLVADRAMKTKAMWDGVVAITRSCFQTYSSFQKVYALSLKENMTELQAKEYSFLESCMEIMRKTTESLLEFERQKSLLNKKQD